MVTPNLVGKNCYGRTTDGLTRDGNNLVVVRGRTGAPVCVPTGDGCEVTTAAGLYVTIVGRERSEITSVDGELRSRSNQAKRGALIRSVRTVSYYDAGDDGAEGGVGDSVGGSGAGRGLDRNTGVGSNVIDGACNSGGGPSYGGC